MLKIFDLKNAQAEYKTREGIEKIMRLFYNKATQEETINNFFTSRLLA